MENITIKRKLAEEALDQLKSAQQDQFVQSTQNVIDELEVVLKNDAQKTFRQWLEERWNEYRFATNNEDAWLFKQWLACKNY